MDFTLALRMSKKEFRSKKTPNFGLSRSKRERLFFCKEMIIMREHCVGVDSIAVGSSAGISDCVKWRPHWKIEKYDRDMKLYAVEEIDGNMLLTEGVSELLKLACGISGATPFNNTNSYIGIGDGTDEASAEQTGLMGGNKSYAHMDATYPKISGNSVIFRATFGPDVANYPWREFTVANGNSDAAINLNRKVETSPRTKVFPDTWIVQLQISIS